MSGTCRSEELARAGIIGYIYIYIQVGDGTVSCLSKEQPEGVQISHLYS